MNDLHDGRDDRADDEAIDWAIRMIEPDADWDAFLAWLEEDPGRSNRYDRAASALRDAEEAVAESPPLSSPSHSSPVAANDGDAVPPPSRRRPVGRWIGGALAAVAVGVVGIGVWRDGSQPYAVTTAPGEQRTVALADGSSIVLAGASSVALDHADPRSATVTRGEMLFRIRHDAARPFTVRAGGLTLVDLGTVFDVKTTPVRTRVAVAEGAVMVDPDGAALRLDPGQAVVGDGTSLRRQSVDPADVGGWRGGRLSFDGATLEEVASDLTRELGRRVHVAPAIATRAFRGTLDVRALRDRPALLGSLLDVRVRRQADGWMLEPH